jgi:hypothetical protein
VAKVTAEALQSPAADAEQQHRRGCHGRHGMLVCTGCAKTVLITIRMRVAGREIVFHRCSKCEANTWKDDEGVLSLTEVLELARAAH